MVRRLLVTVLPVVGVSLLGLPLLGSGVASAQGRDRTPPTTPTNLRVVATTPYSVTLAWNASTDNSGQFSYSICCGGTTSATVPGTATSFTYTSGLEAGRPFSFRIFAVDAAGNASRYSNSVSGTLPSDSVPPSTPVVGVTETGPTHIVLNWRSTDNGPHVWYWVTMDGQPVVQGTANTSGTIGLLQPQTTHTFTVRARDFASNWSPISAPVTASTTASNPNDHTAPGTPTNLRESHWSDFETNLRWDQVTDDLDPQAVIQYKIHVNGVLDHIIVGAGRTVVYGQAGLNTMTVTAVDTAGNESAPATITFEI